MKTYLHNRLKKLLVVTGILVAAVILGMTLGTGHGTWQANASGKTPVPFGSTVHEFILKQPTAWLFKGN